MKFAAHFCLVALVLLAGTIAVHAQGNSSITLYAVNKYHGSRNSCLNFDATVPPGTCHLRYGSLYAGDDLDWFEASAAFNNRTVMKDLGVYGWADDVKLPELAPLPKLKPGEQRHVTIDTSGADGLPGANGLNADGTRRADVADQRARPAAPKREAGTIVDGPFLKAIQDHLYLIHVVNDVDDFYALVRVDAVTRGDNVTVIWHRVNPPVTESTNSN
jgi:hypothetical protein